MLARFEFMSLAAAFLLVALHCGTADAQGTDVRTDDGLYMRFRGWTGEILSLVNMGQSVDITSWEEYESPFTVIEHGSESAPWAMRTSITPESDNRLALEGSNEEAGISLAGHISGHSSFVKFELELGDSRGEDRALTLRLGIPIDAEGWLWWDDIAHSRVIEGGKRYVRYDDETRGIYPLCWYPLGTVSQPDGAHAFSFAVGMDPPSLLRAGYDGEFFAEFDIGLSRSAKTAGKANLTLYFFNSRPAWGARVALKKYYDIFPELFAKLVPREGNWIARSPTQFIPGIEDFYPAFHEASSVRPNSVPFDKKAGMYSFRYDEPGAVGIALGADERVSHDSAVAQLGEMADSDIPADRKLAAKVEALGIKRADGRYDFISTNAGERRGFRSRFVINLDPAVPAPPGGESPIDSWRNSQKKAILGLREGRFDGQYIDSAEFLCDRINHRADHFAYTDPPLVWDPASGRVGIHNSISTWAYLKEVSREIRGAGKLMMANWTPWRYGFFVPVFDITGTEVWESPQGWLEVAERRYGDLTDLEKLRDDGLTDQEINWIRKMLRARKDGKLSSLPQIAWQREDLMYYRRAMSYQKPYCLLLKLMNEAEVKTFGAERYRAYIEWCLFFGIYPSCSEGAWQGEATDLIRPLYKQYMPIARAMGEAGWEPVTHALTDDPDIRVERFGYAIQHTLHFTVRNFGTEPKTFKLSIDADSLAIPEGAAATNALTGEPLPAEKAGKRIVVESSLDPGRTSVVRISL